MKNYLALLVFLFLISCGDSSEKKSKKRICETYSKRLSTIDMEKCINDKTYFDNLTVSYTSILQIDYLEKFNNYTINFNFVDVGVEDSEYELVNIDKFVNDNKISSNENLLLLNDDANRKKIKFKSYFEVNLPEEQTEYEVKFYDSFNNMISAIKDKKDSNIPKLSNAKFQNVEIKKKYEDFINNGFSNSFTGVDFKMPLSNDQSVIYGYFLTTEYSGIEIITNHINLLLNNNFDFEDLENKKVKVSEFFITDIKLNKITYTPQEVIDFIKQDELGFALIRMGLASE